MRATYIVVILAPLGIAYAVVPFDVWLRVLNRATTWLGPTAIKLAQWASTRPDVFSAQVPKTVNRFPLIID